MIGGTIMKKKWIIFTITILAIIVLGVNQTRSPHGIDTWENTNMTRSKVEIREKWNEYQPKNKANPYIEEPRYEYPYRSGKIEPAFIDDGVNMANFVRYLAGLPDDLVADADLNIQAQYGAVLLAATESLTHDPPKSNDMESNFYQIGSRATKRSNLAANIYSLSDSVIGYMMDFGDSNLENVGHRRWILNPQMKTIGFGYCNGYSVMKILNQDRAEDFDYDYITFPTEGYFPSSLFYASCCPYGSNPWSIILNPDIYDNEKLSQIRVKLVDLNDKSKEWRFCPKDTKSNCEKYFKVDTSSCGVPFCIIFRPDDIYDYHDGSSYKVLVTGLYTVEGKETDIEYVVNFFDL